MGFIKLNCPNCGANIDLDSSREFGFCQYCGTKVVQDKVIVEHRGNVGIDRSAEINNLRVRAEEFFYRKQFETAAAYYNKILDIDASNITARNKLAEIQKILNTPNFVLRRISSDQSDNKRPITVIIDGSQRLYLNVGDVITFKLSIGVHRIHVRSSNKQTNTYTVTVKEYPDQCVLVFQIKLAGRISLVPQTSPKLNAKNADSKSNLGFFCTIFAIIAACILFFMIFVGVMSGADSTDSNDTSQTNLQAAYFFRESIHEFRL